MILYHGTNTQHLQKILKEGIKPRYENESNWEDNPSRSDMVYLTNSYAPYFALMQCDADQDFIKPVVIEVDVPTKKLFPDEDYLEQFTRGDPEWKTVVDATTMEERTAMFKNELLKYHEFGLQSLTGLGNCCFKGVILPKRIKRYTILDASLVLTYSDPTITLMNQRFMGAMYHEICSKKIWQKPFSLDVFEV